MRYNLCGFLSPSFMKRKLKRSTESGDIDSKSHDIEKRSINLLENVLKITTSGQSRAIISQMPE